MQDLAGKEGTIEPFFLPGSSRTDSETFRRLLDSEEKTGKKEKERSSISYIENIKPSYDRNKLTGM